MKEGDEAVEFGQVGARKFRLKGSPDTVKPLARARSYYVREFINRSQQHFGEAYGKTWIGFALQPGELGTLNTTCKAWRLA
jgi:hypothetical protein